MAKRRGRWVFVPLEKWETLPPEYYCLKRSQIVCQLFFRNLPPDLYDYCVSNAVLPPARLSRFRLVKWIEEHRTAAQAVVMVGSSNARRGAGGSSKGRGKRFSQVKRKTDALKFD